MTTILTTWDCHPIGILLQIPTVSTRTNTNPDRSGVQVSEANIYNLINQESELQTPFWKKKKRSPNIIDKLANRVMSSINSIFMAGMKYSYATVTRIKTVEHTAVFFLLEETDPEPMILQENNPQLCMSQQTDFVLELVIIPAFQKVRQCSFMYRELQWQHWKPNPTFCWGGKHKVSFYRTIKPFTRTRYNAKKFNLTLTAYLSE